MKEISSPFLMTGCINYRDDSFSLVDSSYATSGSLL